MESTSAQLDEAGIHRFTPADSGFLSRNRHVIESIIDLTGGTAGGIATVYVGQPLDTVKVKLQTFPALYRNALDCFLRTYREQGVARGLYAGTAPSLVSNVAENAVLFVAYGLCQKAVAWLAGKDSVDKLSSLQNAASGSAASMFSAMVVAPTELVKCRLQAMIEMQTSGKLTGALAATKNIGPSSLVKQILKTEGLTGFFHGFQATLMREMPGYFCFFGGYEGCRVLLTPPGKTKDDLSQLRLLLCGGLGGVCFWVSVFPMDVIKSRYQVEKGSQTTTSHLSYRQVALSIAREGGVRAFYSGLGPTVIRTFCATAALFVAYENTKQLLTTALYGPKTPGEVT